MAPGSKLAPELELIESADDPAPNTSELSTDCPGRRFESAGSSRGACEAPDYHQQEEDHFAGDAAAQLNRIAATGVHKLILVADPRVLGTMRPHFASATRSLLIGEIAKDYAGRPARDVAELLVRHET